MRRDKIKGIKRERKREGKREKERERRRERRRGTRRGGRRREREEREKERQRETEREREGEREGQIERGRVLCKCEYNTHLSVHEGEDRLQQHDLLSHLKLIQLSTVVHSTLGPQQRWEGGRE